MDYVKVDIFYEDLNYERIMETPEIEVSMNCDMSGKEAFFD